MKSFAWSYSNLDSYETCPKRHFLTRVSKTVVEPAGLALLEGREVHTALQKRLDGTAPLPQHLAYCEGVCDLITRQHGRRLVEEKLAIDAAFNPLRKSDGTCDWFNKKVWCRSVVDVGIIGPRFAVVADWKTGNRKPDNDQLELFAAVCFAHYPFLEKIHTAFIWLKDRKIDAAPFTREQVSEIWNSFLPRVRRLEAAYQQNVWNPKPSGLCGKWCPVTRAHCEFGKTT